MAPLLTRGARLDAHRFRDRGDLVAQAESRLGAMLAVCCREGIRLRAAYGTWSLGSANGALADIGVGSDGLNGHPGHPGVLLCHG